MLALLALVACDKNDKPKPDPGTTAAPSATDTPATTASASAPPATTAATSGAAAASGAGAASVAAAASAPAAVAAATGSPPKPGTTATAAATGELPGAEGMTASGDHWAVTVPAPKTCATGSPCPIVVTLEAKDGFHVNEEYPTKLELDASKQVEGLATTAGKPNVFTKAAGNFAIAGGRGTMTASVKPLEGGLAKLSGTFKFSVCSAANCQMGTAQVKATLPVR